MNSGRIAPIWILIILGVFVSLYLLQSNSSPKPDSRVPYSNLLEFVEQGRVDKVLIEERNITATLDNGDEITTYAPEDDSLIAILRARGVVIEAKAKTEDFPWLGLLLNFLPFLLLIGIIVWVTRSMQQGGRNGLGFGRSKAKLLEENTNKVTFEDVAGIEEAKQDVEEIVEFLKEPQKFQRLGGKIPRGVLLVGPPGTGKTLLARAIAGEAEVPFFSIAGSDFVEMFVGVGASRVRSMFEEAKKNAPCIIFVDEIDAVGRARSNGVSGGHEEREQTLNQLLVELDGFEVNEGIIVIAATNRADILDKALLRPGRFDRQVPVQLPDVKGREKILGVHMQKVPASPNVDLGLIARGTVGMSGADLANVINEAALRAARNNKRMVTHDDLEWAKEKVLFGSERRSMEQKQEEVRKTAYHEAGHAIVSIYTPVKAPLHKLTIIPRSKSLGYALYLPEDDNYSLSLEQMRAQLAMTYGGRIAEELIYGIDKITTGASQDIRQASELARRMVEEWGFNSLGPIFMGRDENSMLSERDISDATRTLVDKEVKELVCQGEEKAREVLTEHIDALHRLAEALIRLENMTGDEVRRVVLDGEEIERDVPPVRGSGVGHRSTLPSGGSDQLG